ncbi:MAG: PrsW family intramembrane metalloprotease [Myxococcales bacterium]|nr:PrsW family intramembrane metalloprotease [Myxococcales bacterium]
MNLGFAILLALPAPILGALVWRRVGSLRPVSSRVVLAVVAASALVGGLALYVERLLLRFTDLSLQIQGGNAATAALATFLLAAPLEEAAKVACVWPLYATGRLLSPRVGLLYGVAAGVGLSVVELLSLSRGLELNGLVLAQLSLGIPVQLFASGLWGYWLGRGDRPRGKWFRVAWLLAVGIHGLYALLISSGAPKLVASALPLALSMGGTGWIALRDMTPIEGSIGHERRGILRSLPEPPSLRAMRRALRRSDRPIMLHWILIGGLVTLGVMLVCVAGAVWLGHELAIDFSHAESSGPEAGAPLFLLGSAVLLSFPLAGFLVARASAATSVLEPALGACIAIVLLALTLSVSTSSGVLMSLGLAPVAFLLACVGAWFGTSG